MPPAGGFEAVKYKRNLPFRGPGGLAILTGVTAICAYGFYRVGTGNLEKRYTFMPQTRHPIYLQCSQVSWPWNVSSSPPLIAKRGPLGSGRSRELLSCGLSARFLTNLS